MLRLRLISVPLYVDRGEMCSENPKLRGAAFCQLYGKFLVYEKRRDYNDMKEAIGWIP